MIHISKVLRSLLALVISFREGKIRLKGGQNRASELGDLNIWDLKKCNLAFLAKLGWSIVFNKDALWVDLLNKKYLRKTDFLSAVARPSDSYTWRSIKKGRGVLEGGLAVNIGNGLSTKFWLDSWCIFSPLIQHANVSITENEADASVSEFCDATVSSAYRNQFADGPSSPNPWGQVWDIQCTSKQHIFLWRLAHNSLPTSLLLHNRRLLLVPTCFRCSSQVETALHALRLSAQLTFPVRWAAFLVFLPAWVSIVQGKKKGSELLGADNLGEVGAGRLLLLAIRAACLPFLTNCKVVSHALPSKVPHAARMKASLREQQIVGTINERQLSELCSLVLSAQRTVKANHQTASRQKRTEDNP
ncbi:RNA-directed DNA polymerase (reversetranscriptase)-related family protein [Striga asiatica]|uniref:RNA-directed DNA polymerase (Reversetranscriptase)-related family protein n=1 Tax=Striga asiatica TaxID=4170 RepID=A0A5A7Q2H9_STRAF|nr:RNA-directed DNA polymerase (reversetranscriptase)-related family protein [Striga asiatica]